MKSTFIDVFTTKTDSPPLITYQHRSTKRPRLEAKIFNFLLVLAALSFLAFQRTPAFAQCETGPVKNVTRNVSFCTIQAAINDAVTVAGDEILINDGTYTENVIINKPLIIRGQSRSGTIISGTSNAGVVFSANNITLKTISVTGFTNGLRVNNDAVTDLTVDDVDAKGNSIGFYVSIQSNGNGSDVFDRVTIKNSDFSNSARKGLYFERGRNITIDNVTITNSGTATDNGNNNAGIDLNFKFGSYSGIVIKNSVITNNGVTATSGFSGSPQPDAPVSLTIKARRDASYSSKPATLSNVLIEGNVISGPQNGIRIGEPGTIDDGTSGITIKRNNLSASFANKALVNRTSNNIELLCNWHGSIKKIVITPTLAAASSGLNNLTTVSGSNTVQTDPTETSCIPPVIPSRFYVNDNVQTGDGFTLAVGNDANPGTAALPFLTIAHAISVTKATDSIFVDAGTFTEDFNINKSLFIKGLTAESTIIKGTYAGNTKTITVSAAHVTIKRLTVTRDFGGSLSTWQNSSKTEGIIVENVDALVLDSLIVRDHRTGVYVHSSKNFIVKNSNITDNRTGFQIWGDLTDGQITNNKITSNFTHGIVFNFEQGASIGKGLKIKDNFISGNWFSQINMQASPKGLNTGDMTGMDISCNWFGSSPSYSETVVSGAPGYDTQVPTQFTGTNTNTNPAYSLAGLNASYTAFSSFYTSAASTAIIGFVPTGICSSPVHNTNSLSNFATIQQAIDAASANDSIQIDGGNYTEILAINKVLKFGGAGAGVCGTSGRPAIETVLNAPLTGNNNLINLSGAVSATFNGFKIVGKSIASITQANQNLTIKNSVVELNFLPSENNLYFSSGTLTLECNLFKARSGSNNGASSHILFSGSALNVSKNRFTSIDARPSMNINTRELPVWINLTTNTNNTNIHHNEFTQIDIGILIADNAGNVKIENNDFNEANRETLPFGNAPGAGIALFGNLSPVGPIIIKNNKFHHSDSGIRTSGSGSAFPTADKLVIGYNSFESMSDKAIRVGGEYASATNKLNALCNWFGNASGPAIAATNDGGTGTQILDGNDKVAFKNWLIYGTDAVTTELGFQLPNTVTVSNVTNSSVAVNNYRILSNAIGCAVTGQTIALSGTFDYTGIALTEWSKGNDGDVNTTADNYVITAPANLNNVTITGPATIAGPGDVPTANLEGFLTFNNGYNRNWDISGLTIKDFDLSIGFFSTANYPTNNSDVKIHDNTFYIPKDLNATVAPGDLSQNIGIHLSNGANQIINNNTVYIDGTGESVDANIRSTSIFLQSNTTGGNGYDGLKITNNKIKVTGMPQPEPKQAVIRGIWENSHSTGSAIEISANTFENIEDENTALLNRQFAFWITSRSGTGKNVVYKNNEVTNFSEGIGWLGGLYTANTPPDYETSATPVLIQNNKFTGVKNGVVVRKSAGSANTTSPAIINDNSFTSIPANGFAIVNEASGLADASCNGYDVQLVSSVISNGPGGVTFLPKRSNGTDINTALAGFQFDNVANKCVLPVLNESSGLDYLTIQQAIDAAGESNTIRISAGIYPENVIINKKLTIYGVDSSSVIVDKGGANYNENGGAGFSLQANGIKLSTVKVQNFNHGIETGSETADVIIDAVNLNENFSNGFFGKRTVTNLIIRNSHLNGNGYKNGIQTASIYKRGIMFESQGGSINNLIIDNNITDHNGLVGIDISGLIPINGLTINGNKARGNFDSQIGVSLGNNLLTGAPVTVTGNTAVVSKASRFGIEIKNPLGTGAPAGNGSIMVSGNTISVAGHTGTARDLAGIAVMRRKDGHTTIHDQPQGVQLVGNVISDFQNAGGDAFGIVLGGTGHFVSGNTITNTKYSIQLQKGNSGFNTDASALNSADNYFERDNSADVCVEFGSNTITSSGAPRLVTSGSTESPTLPTVRVKNTTWPTKFCTIQQAIDFTATTTGHIIQPDAGIYPENVIVSKSISLRGPNSATAGNGSRVSEAVIVPGVDNISTGTLIKVQANDVKLEGLSIDGTGAFPASVTINGVPTHAAYGVLASGNITGLTIQNNIIKNLSKHGIDLDAVDG